MDKVSQNVNEVIQNFISDVKKHVTVNKAILYGSYTKGNYNDFHSDVDVAIFSEDFKDKGFVEATSFLFGLARGYRDICIEPVGFDESDLYDDNPFVKEILQTGKEVNM